MKDNQQGDSLNDGLQNEETKAVKEGSASGSKQSKNQSTSGMALAGMVLGIVGILTSIVPIINNMSIIIGIIGLILAIVGMVGINKGKNKGKGFAIAGLVLNILTIILVLASQAFYSAALDAASDSIKAKPATSSQTESGQADSDQATNAQENSSDSAYGITIDGARVESDYAGDRALVVTFTFTNNSDKDTQFMTAISDKAYQNGVQLESTFNSALWNKGNDEIKTLKTGSTITIEQGYKLVDSSPVTVEVQELFDFKNTILAEATFDVA